MVNHDLSKKIFYELFILGIGGILQAYQNCVAQIQLWGPTNFSPIINHVGRFATEAKQHNTAQVSFKRALLLEIP